MPEPRLDLDDFLCFAIHSTAHAIQRANKPQLDALGLTYPQYLVMVVLWMQDDQTVGSIGERLFLESSTLTPLLKRLETAGYLRRVRDAADERQVRVRLTEEGRALREKVRHTPGWLEQAFGGNTEEAKALRESVIRLRDRLLQGQR
ncbi:MarR family transcriptional regulator [Roseomonas sp. E05]|uniref:MarR family winged helix-turn-helix transcriptional regulator n=1 Tax=Roseomonas sp. E05 TaxID=3046310 RepID=UPI0024BBDB62|nr:MarR family transcriptional regulator [Roseomonas sp. E05]MDJ0386923.1 MarR family transcriptional regulator [Roseomonas sp. E05]